MDKSREILVSGMAELDLIATEVQVDLLLSFVNLMIKWNKAYNLTAIREREKMLRLHVLDSLAVMPFIVAGEIVDVGSGAGLPSIPLAILLPDVQFLSLDSNSKKTRFVRQVVMGLGLKNIEVVHSRVEALRRDGEFDAVISRAFSNTNDMVRMTGHLLKPAGVFIAMKGQIAGVDQETIELPYTVDSIKVPGIDAERCVVRINKR